MELTANWKYAQEMGNWLNNMQFDESGELSTPWDYWFTGTFKYEATLKSARRASQNFIKSVNPDIAFWGTEAGKETGRNHIHGLLHFRTLTPPPAKTLWNWWFTRYGRAHVDKFEQEKGAVHYVSKYVAKQMTDYDLQGKGLRCPEF